MGLGSCFPPGSIKGDVKKKDFSLLGGKEEVPDIQPHSLLVGKVLRRSECL
jgi:hypothetical protein